LTRRGYFNAIFEHFLYRCPFRHYALSLSSNIGNINSALYVDNKAIAVLFSCHKMEKLKMRCFCSGILLNAGLPDASRIGHIFEPKGQNVW
jgi:hypothetical protein